MENRASGVAYILPAPRARSCKLVGSDEPRPRDRPPRARGRIGGEEPRHAPRMRWHCCDAGTWLEDGYYRAR